MKHDRVKTAIVRPGWKVVPTAMTAAMLAASKQALKEYISRLPASEREKCKRMDGGYKVGVNLKHELRYRAALHAAPPPPE